MTDGGENPISPAFNVLPSGQAHWLADALRLQYILAMKAATLPPVRVAPDFRQELEGVLEEGETLSQFVESAVRSVVGKRKHQAGFVCRGIAAIQETQRTGSGIPAEQVVARLEAKLNAARQAKARRELLHVRC